MVEVLVIDAEDGHMAWEQRPMPDPLGRPVVLVRRPSGREVPATSHPPYAVARARAWRAHQADEVIARWQAFARGTTSKWPGMASDPLEDAWIWADFILRVWHVHHWERESGRLLLTPRGSATHDQGLSLQRAIAAVRRRLALASRDGGRPPTRNPPGGFGLMQGALRQ